MTNDEPKTENSDQTIELMQRIIDIQNKELNDKQNDIDSLNKSCCSDSLELDEKNKSINDLLKNIELLKETKTLFNQINNSQSFTIDSLKSIVKSKDEIIQMQNETIAKLKEYTKHLELSRNHFEREFERAELIVKKKFFNKIFWFLKFN